MLGDNDTIMNYLQGKLRYVFDISGYKIPSSLDGFNYITDRQRELTGHCSSYVKKFETDIKRLGGQKQQYPEAWEYIREFPVPIEDIELYQTCLDITEVSETSQFRNYKHFKLDFLFPYVGLIVEIDSNYHDDKKEYDQARDIYMKNKYGLEVIRLYEYGKNEKLRSGMLKSVSLFIESYKKRWRISGEIPKKVIIDFTSSIVDNYQSQHKRYFKLIRKSIILMSRKEWLLGDTIEIKVSNYITDYPLDDKIFIMELEEIIKYIYHKKLILT